MKKPLITLTFTALITAGAFWLCARQTAPTTASAPSPSAPVTCCGAARPFVEKADARESGLPPSADVLWCTPSSISALADFQRWADDYIAAPSAEKAARGLALAAARRAEMISLIQSDPALALANTVPLAVRRALPAEVQALLEDRIDAKGDYLTAGVSFAPGQGPGADPVVSTHVRLADGRQFRAHTFGRREYQPTRRGRPVHGIALGNQLAVMELPGRVMEPLELAEAKATLGAVMCPVSELPTASKGREVGLLIAAEPKIYCEPEHAEVELYEGEWAELAAGHAGHTGPRSAASGGEGDAEDDSPSRAPLGWTTGKKSILAVRVNFPVDDDATEGLDRHQLSAGNCTEIINRIGARLKEWSYGRLEIKPVGSGGSGVTPVIHMDDPAEDYLRSEFWYGMYDEALDKAEDDHGYDDDAYDFYIILAGTAPVTDDVTDPDNPVPATFGGVGYVGEAGCMVRVNDPSWTTEERIAANVNVALHELGHNFGLLHASSLYRLPPGGQWTFGRVEYGDAYDQMGSGVDFSAHNKKWLRWLDNANVPFLNGSGIHTIRESDMEEKSGSRGLQVKIGTTERRTDLSIEYRLNGVELQDNGPFRQWNHQQMAFGAIIRLARSWAPKTFLMDSTEETPGGELFTGRVDSPLLPGRTFRTSRPNGGNLYVTNLEADPIAGELTVDIQYGEPAGNRAPTGGIVFHSSFVGVGDKVLLTANATDPDGDALAYFWSVPVLNGDRPSQYAVFPNSRSIVVQFPTEGIQQVNCIVTDRHGGTNNLVASLVVGTNDAPTISVINDKTMSEDGTLAVPFTIGDSGTDPDLLTVTAVGLDLPENLPSVTTIEGTGANRTLIYTPAANQHGKDSLQVQVSDGTSTAVEVFTITVLPQTPGTVLLPMRSANWRYSATAQSPPANWMSRTFDDSSWAMDNGEFSYPLPVPNFVDATNLGSVIGRTTCYFRRQFIVPAIPSGTPMVRMICDDGAVVYLNGVEVYRHNMPDGPIAPSTLASSSVEGVKEKENIIFPLDPGLLNNGQANLIAVEVHDAGGARGAGDVIFDLEFILTHPPIVSQIDDVTVMAGTYSADANFTASDFESGGGPLSFTLLSSNPALLPLSSLKVHERPNGYYVSIKPPQVPGSSVITVRVSDGRAETWRSFTFTATPFNATPVIEPIADYSQSLGQGPALIEITLSDVDSDLSTLVVTTSSDADSVVPTGAITVLPGNDPSKRWLKITPKPATVGSTPVYVFVDDGSGSSSEGFVFKVLQSAQPTTSPAKLIPRGSQWLMWAAPLPGGEKPIDFTAPNLDDSAWTAITTPAEGSIPAAPLRVTTYFRRSFEAGAPVGIARLAMGLRCDDGAAIYLNGTLIWLNNLPAGSLDAATLATKEVTEAEEGLWQALDASPSLLKQGRNVIAVELHQSAMPNGEAPGDPVFDFEMYAMPVAGAPATPSSALITPGSTWHYWDYPVDHANDDLASRRWTLSGFDMGGIWKSGTAPLGYGTGEEATVINRFQDVGGSALTTIPSALFRRGFDVPDPAAFTTLHLYLRRDDGAAVYLNGERILLDNLAPHDNLPTASALSPATVETRSQWHHSTVSARRLRAGRNYIAVSVHQHAATESILAFDLQLIGQMTTEPELSLKMQSGPEGGPPEISWSAAHAGWTVEHSTDLRNWAPYTVPPMVDGPKLRLWLTNPGERGFFRLVSPADPGGAR